MHTHLPDGDVLELRGPREYSKQFYLTEGGLEQLVVGCHGFIGDVVVAGNSTKISDLVCECTCICVYIMISLLLIH